MVMGQAVDDRAGVAGLSCLVLDENRRVRCRFFFWFPVPLFFPECRTLTPPLRMMGPVRTCAGLPLLELVQEFAGETLEKQRRRHTKMTRSELRMTGHEAVFHINVNNEHSG